MGTKKACHIDMKLIIQYIYIITKFFSGKFYMSQLKSPLQMSYPNVQSTVGQHYEF